MMKFRPAMESVELRPGEIEDKDYITPVSAGAHMEICIDIARGICKSLSKALVTRGVDKTEIQAKNVEIIQMFIKNGDLSGDVKQWLIEEKDYAECSTTDWEELEKAQRPNKYSSWYYIRESAVMGMGCTLDWNTECIKKMNEREKALVQRLNEARDAFYKARQEYTDYVTDHAIMSINDIFVKYGDMLSKMDEEWFKGVSEELKWEVERVLRRRAEKRGESDSTIDRATPALVVE